MDYVEQHPAVDRIREVYQLLEPDVYRVLRAYRGNADQLNAQRRRALQLLDSAREHQHRFPLDEWVRLQANIDDMVVALDAACSEAADPVDDQPFVVVSRPKDRSAQPTQG
ncbi:hypothetical protein NLJ89_g12291 [Agrocybe chaxingu]|uniref:Uncharacterized protein n=1 Tax=Agrocybe chaxingu TaxID=84603 RepID=A0A9W8JNK0_9AGAR|nr:hypothetical protein NLJ89_g12291 [Agrocybe chaxingu]